MEGSQLMYIKFIHIQVVYVMGYTRGIWKVMHIDPYNFTQ